jgi:hypothetical protein
VSPFNDGEIMKKLQSAVIRNVLLLVSALVSSSPVQADLHDRGGGLIYDDALDITWLQDVNYSVQDGFDSDGQMTWYDAISWVGSLNYYDSVRNRWIGGWRLPQANPINGITHVDVLSYDGTADWGYNITSSNSELAHLFYVTLGNPGYYDVDGDPTGCFVSGYNTCQKNGGPFAMPVLHSDYWTETQYDSDTTLVWGFFFGNGFQDHNSKNNDYRAWAVHDGDVASIPEPNAWSMLIAGLGMVWAAARRRLG